jgi:hypothetical protein
MMGKAACNGRRLIAPEILVEIEAEAVVGAGAADENG